MMDEKETIREMYRKYWHSMIAKDADGLRSLMADDYYLFHMTGVKQSAKVFLKGLLDKTFFNYETDKGRTAYHAILPQNQLLSIHVNHDLFVNPRGLHKIFYTTRDRSHQ